MGSLAESRGIKRQAGVLRVKSDSFEVDGRLKVHGVYSRWCIDVGIVCKWLGYGSLYYVVHIILRVPS